MDDKAVRVRDSFDIGTPAGAPTSLVLSDRNKVLLDTLVSNPSKMVDMFGMTPQQAENVSQILTSTGAGLGSLLTQRLLTQAVGRRMAAALGGALGGYLTAMGLEKVLGEDK